LAPDDYDMEQLPPAIFAGGDLRWSPVSMAQGRSMVLAPHARTDTGLYRAISGDPGSRPTFSHAFLDYLAEQGERPRARRSANGFHSSGYQLPDAVDGSWHEALLPWVGHVRAKLGLTREEALREAMRIWPGILSDWDTRTDFGGRARDAEGFLRFRVEEIWDADDADPKGRRLYLFGRDARQRREQQAADTHLPADFWEARSALARIRDAAWSRQRSPDAVLGGVLTRVAAGLPHALGLPPIVGSDVGLSLLTAVVGPPGVGKSGAVSISGQVYETPERVRVIPSGSGEGILDQLFQYVTEGTGKEKRKLKRQTRHNLLSVVDEGAQTTAVAGRNGSTLYSTWRSIFTGAMVGDANAAEDRRRIVPEGAYSIGVLLIFQPKALAPLFADLGHGTPQRFWYVAGSDPAIPAEPPAWPDPVVVPVPDLSRLQSPGFQTGRDRFLNVAPEIEAEIRERDLAKQRGLLQVGDWHAHIDLLRLKLAALLTVLGGRLTVTVSDWELAEVMVRTSDAVRKAAHADIEADTSGRDEAAGRRAGKRQAVAEEAAAAERFERTVTQVVELVRKRPGEDSIGSLQARVTKTSRDYVAEAVAAAIERGLIREHHSAGQGEAKVRYEPA
jgi:hypothetical protein